MKPGAGAGEFLRLVRASARLIAGRRYWIAPLVPLVWIAFQVMRLLVGWQREPYAAEHVQNALIGFPLVVLAIGLGGRIIASEIDRRTLEIAYTVPGGARRVWTAKLVAAVGLLLAAEILLALATWAFCATFPPVLLYGAFQAAAFYLVLTLWLSVLTRSEAAGALLTSLVLSFNFMLQSNNVRVSPFWNSEWRGGGGDAASLLAQAVQNRIGFALAIAAIVALAFSGAERRERLLGG